MASCKMLAVVLLVTLAASGVQCLDKKDPDPTPGPPPSCMDLKTKKDCKHGADCAWCISKFGPAMETCQDESQAKYLPPSVYDCKTWGPKNEEQAVVSVAATASATGDVDTEPEATAFAGGDVDDLPIASASGSAEDEEEAFATASATGGAEDEEEGLATASATGGAEDEEEGLATASATGGAEDEEEAFATASATGGADDEGEAFATASATGGAEDEEEAFATASATGGAEDEGELFATASATGGAEDEEEAFATASATGGAEDDPEPTPEPGPEPAPEPKCDDLKSAKECIKGKAKKQEQLELALGKKAGKGAPRLDCSWCTNKYVPGADASSCYPDVVAKSLPPMVFKCESGDDEATALKA